MHADLIEAPLQNHPCSDFPVIQYADDTVLIMPACTSQLQHLKNLLMHFTVFSGLKLIMTSLSLYPSTQVIIR